MGRIFEALKQAGQPLPAPDSLAPLSPPAEPSEETAAATDEIPFIEVGGPGATLEASARVLASTPKKGPSHPAALPPVLASPAPGEASRLLGPVGVAYQPLPAGARCGGPAAQRFSPHLIAFHQPDHPVSEQYRAVLAGMTAHLAGGPQILLLAAPARGTGTTTVLLNLALTRARLSNRRVVVVDANLRHPTVAAQLGLSPVPGLRDAVARSVPLMRAIQESGQPELAVLAAGEAIPPGGAWPMGEALRAVLQQLRRQFDWVLVDAPSWDEGPEMVALCSGCDTVFLVLRPADVGTAGVAELGRLIPPLGSSLGGYLLTQR
jgi:Mrp family chromosome partitioning ATPase